MAPILKTIEHNQRLPSEPISHDSSATQFHRCLAQIRDRFHQDNGKINVDQIWRILEAMDSRECFGEWSRFAEYDTRLYKRNLVDDSPHYNVMLLSWAPGAKSCIHDHSGSHCFMKILDGELIESRFAWPAQYGAQSNDQEGEGREMTLLTSHRLGVDKVLYINDKVGLHCVENPNKSKTAASLHVYIPPFKVCKAFDQRTGRARNCKLSFDNVPSSDSQSSVGENKGAAKRADKLLSCRETINRPEDQRSD